MKSTYSDAKTAKLGRYAEALLAQAKGSAFDSATGGDIKSFTKTIDLAGADVPPALAKVAATMGEKAHMALDAVLVGMKAYQERHGELPTADIIESALQQGYSVTAEGRKEAGFALDAVGSSAHSDSLASQPDRAAIAILTAIAEAIPFAVYLPSDLKSNEARLVIVSHVAGTTTGDYEEGDLLDGINCGDAFVASERSVAAALNPARDAATAKISAVTGSVDPVILLRNRTMVFVNGLPCAAESQNQNSGVANSPISGTARIGLADYTITGTVTVATGDVALAFSPALPVGTVVRVEGYIDFEKQPELAPKVVTQAQTYSLFSSPWRGIAQQTIDAQTQYSNELGLDLQSEALVSVRAQQGMERHYMALSKAKEIALNNGNVATFDFDLASQINQKTRAQIFQDIMITLAGVSQKMAEDTMEYGVDLVYVGQSLMELCLSLPESVFRASGITSRPSVYLVGTFSNGVRVYYTPKIVESTASTGQMLCIGRSSQVSRNPIVLGDAVAPLFKQLATNEDLVSGVGFYARSFTAVNPHRESALGCAMINVVNIQ